MADVEYLKSLLGVQCVLASIRLMFWLTGRQPRLSQKGGPLRPAESASAERWQGIVFLDIFPILQGQPLISIL